MEICRGYRRMKVYIVSKQWYEEVYIYGVFTEEKLENALTRMANLELEEARKSKESSRRWYEHLHRPWAERSNVEPTKPYSLTVPLLEYSKSTFDVTEREMNEVVEKPSPLGWGKVDS